MAFSNTGATGSGAFGTVQPTLGSNIFGSNNNTAGKPPSSIFGNTTPASNLFGNTNTSASTGATTGLFGTNKTSSTTPGSGLFGGGNASTPNALGGGFLGGGLTNQSGGGLLTAQTLTGTGTTVPASNVANTVATPNPLGGSLFGAPPATSTETTKTSATSNPLFSTPSTFFSKPADSTPKPPASNFFSLGETSGTTPAAGSSLGGAGLTKPAVATNIPSATPTLATAANGGKTGTNLFGGGGLFSNPPVSTATTTTTSTPSLFSLGGEKKDIQNTSTSTGTGLFGTQKVEEAKKNGAPAAAQPFSMFGGKPDEKKEGSTALTTKEGDKKNTLTTALSVAVAPPSMLRGKTLEEIINKWTTDLGTNARDFDRFGAEVAVWDRALIENGNNIAALYSHVLAAEKHQNEINESLNHIEQQQQDLASTLDAYEKISQEILGGQGSTLRTLDAGPADNERDKNYMLATDLHTHLDDLSGSLTQMITSVNALSISSKSDNSADDPMAQITQILSSHLESLQWIDSAVREVESKASEVERRINLSGHSLGGSSGTRSRGNRA